MTTAATPGHRKANRLAGQTSPYLLQHAYNPVDWWPWGEEAFAEARRRDVPIFLSIGYSTCYWCHVMERESFESEATAKVMNAGFVCIKLDREERPDVDDVYMTAVQAYTGRGGWPMSVFLEPAGLRPFHAGTYYPPEPRYSMPGFTQLLDGITAAWTSQRADVLEQAGALADAVRERMESAPVRRQIGVDQVAAAVGSLVRMHDRLHGGFGGAPKFPQPVFLELLQEFRTHAGDPESRAAVDDVLKLTLDRMARGGIFDQVGGGFHRYSVDERWLVPHFEKMLYDNALLAPIYAQAAVDSSDPFFERTARRTLDYILREMTLPEGGFASAQDAEVNHREGESYLWTLEELQAVLPQDDAAFAADVYGVAEGPNFRDPHHPHEPMRSVLFLRSPIEELAKSRGRALSEFTDRLDRINAILLKARNSREQPSRDDKVLASWNGLMIGAMTRCGVLLREPRYLDAAERAAEFVLSAMQSPDGGLRRTWRAGKAQIEGFLEDHAMLASGLLALHQAGRGAGGTSGTFADAAATLLEHAMKRFGSREPGVYFDASQGQAELFVRPRSSHDGAMPSGTSALIHAMLDCHEATGDEKWLRRAAQALAGVSAAVAESPLSSAGATRSLLRMLTRSQASRDALESALAGAPAAAPPPDLSAEPESSPVAVFASTERLTVGEGEDGAAGFMLRVEIEAGFHVTAPGPGAEALGLAPLNVRVINGAGVEVYAKYPQGEVFEPAAEAAGERGDGGSAEPMRVYTGIVEFPVVVARPKGAAWSGRPLLTVTYQACTDSACLAPAVVELDVALDKA